MTGLCLERREAPAARRRSLTLLLLIVASFIGCAGLLGPRTIIVSDAELSKRLAERFPVERRWLEIFDLHLSNPKVSSNAQSGRLRVAVEVRVGQRLTGNRLAAHLLLFARPRYEASDHSIRITEVDVDAWKIDGGAESILGRAGAWPAALLAQALEDRTIYRFSARQLADIERQGMVLRDITVGERGLQLSFEPA